MRQLVIQYPDGKYHTVNATKFYGVLVNGKEEYILEYDDLTTSKRNCFILLDREGNKFVKRPLTSQAEYSVLAARIRFMKKKLYNLEVLPGKIMLCKDALEALKPYAPPVISQPVSASGSVQTSSPNLPNKTVNKPDEVVVYEDISPTREQFPFYLNREDAVRCGLKIGDKEYYHLKKEEFDVICRYAIVELKKSELNILPQKRKPVVKNNLVNVVEPLNSKEIETLESLFESLMSFEDYYSFFGIEELRNASVDLVLNSPRIIALTKLFDKGIECGNDLAINLSEFLEGFKKSIKEKSMKK